MSTIEVANERAARDENGQQNRVPPGQERDRGRCIARSVGRVRDSGSDLRGTQQPAGTEDRTTQRRCLAAAELDRRPAPPLLPHRPGKRTPALRLEQPRFSLSGAPLFKDDRYLQDFGFIPDQVYEQNPDALPVGFTRDDRFVDPYTGQKLAVLGISCAGCHTGELFYGGKAIR